MRAPEGAQVELFLALMVLVHPVDTHLMQNSQTRSLLIFLREVSRKQTAAANNEQNNPRSVHHSPPSINSRIFVATKNATNVQSIV